MISEAQFNKLVVKGETEDLILADARGDISFTMLPSQLTGEITTTTGKLTSFVEGKGLGRLEAEYKPVPQV